MSNIIYPSSLPPPLHSVSFKPVNPQTSTKMENGRTINRRKFTATPVDFSLKWLMTDTQAVGFENFYRDTLRDGTRWFMIKLLTPQGRKLHKVRFMGIYNGPNRVNTGGDTKGWWEYSSKMQMYLRPQ